MKPEPRIFTNGERCTKLHIWNCFRKRRGFKTPQVDEAHAEIGVNAPKNMLKNGYAVIETVRSKEVYALTEEGEAWLKQGILGFVKRHPDQACDAVYLIKSR